MLDPPVGCSCRDSLTSILNQQGLKGQALSWHNEDFPTSGELRAVIPEDCFEPETAKSLGYLSVSVAGTALCTAVGTSMLSVVPPENPLTWPLWAAYSAMTGTGTYAVCSCVVIANEFVVLICFVANIDSF